jgi:hypothetical protein
MAAMQDLEEHIKEVAADTIAKAFGTDPSSYLDMHNYRDRKKSDPKFSLAYVLSTLNRKLSVNKDPILHYATVYGSVPPWILLKSVYFSTIITFISKYKPTEHRAVAERLYDYEALNLSIDNCRKLMMDTLYICLDYRNSAAHGGRIYLLKTKSRLRSLEIFSDANMDGSGYGQLLYLLNLLRYKEPFNQLKDTLNRELTRHCLHYPDDRTYLANALDINIKSRKIVYVSEGKTKYHAASHCSGMSHVKPIEYDTALKEGYIPCKKCFGRL